MRQIAALWATVMMLGACARQPVEPPRSRAEACANIDNQALLLGGSQFCRPGGAPCADYGVGVACREVNAGEQPVCFRSFPNLPRTAPIAECEPDRTCLLRWLECRPYEPSPDGGTLYGCFSGLPCSAAGADASVQD